VALYNKTMNRIQKYERNPVYVFFGITLFIGLAAYVNITPPISRAHILLFIIGLSVCIGFFVQYLSANMYRTIRISLAVMVYLLLRYANFRSPLYAVLILAIVILLELSIQKK